MDTTTLVTMILMAEADPIGNDIAREQKAKGNKVRQSLGTIKLQ